MIFVNGIGNHRCRVSPFTSRRGNRGSFGHQLRGTRTVSLRAAITSVTSTCGENNARRRGARWFHHLFPDRKQSRSEDCGVRHQGERLPSKRSFFFFCHDTGWKGLVLVLGE